MCNGDKTNPVLKMKTTGIVKALEIQRIDLKTKLEIPWKTTIWDKNEMAYTGFEPVTFALLARRSNQLS